MIHPNSKYKPEVCAHIVTLGSEGKTRAQMASALGIDKSTLAEWSKDIRKPEFMEAFRMAIAASQGYHEDLLIKGVKGIIPKYCAAAHIFFMKNVFKEDYAESSTQKIELKNEIKGMTTQEIDEAIKALLAQRNVVKEATSETEKAD